MTTTDLTIADLNLSGSDDAFYLNDGESVLWIRDNGDGSAVVRIKFHSGIEDCIDADIRNATTTQPHSFAAAMALAHEALKTGKNIDAAIAALRSVKTRRNVSSSSGQAGQIRAMVANLESSR